MHRDPVLQVLAEQLRRTRLSFKWRSSEEAYAQQARALAGDTLPPCTTPSYGKPEPDEP